MTNKVEKSYKTPLKDLRNSALDEYEIGAEAIHSWNSFIVDAIKNYNPENNKSGNSAIKDEGNDYSTVVQDIIEANRNKRIDRIEVFEPALEDDYLCFFFWIKKDNNK